MTFSIFKTSPMQHLNNGEETFQGIQSLPNAEQISQNFQQAIVGRGDVSMEHAK